MNEMFKPYPWNLEETLKKMYNVPVYQRPYSWEKDQIDTLLEDIYEAYNGNTNICYYCGNIIVQDNNDKYNGSICVFEVVDGQQRITTFALIMLAIYCIAANNNIEQTDNTIIKIRNSLWKIQNRKLDKNAKVISLNSIEKNIFKDLYDYCFNAYDSNFNIENYCKNYNCTNKYEEILINNFYNIYCFILNKVVSNGIDYFLDFVDYILQEVYFIVIQSSYPKNRVFSLFESINSKGKKLDTIDLIKTYIFSNLDDKDYDRYLEIWGDLIFKTNDNLYDYIYTFIKAYICFYDHKINIQNFKSICKKELLEHYCENNLSQVLKKFLNDLKDKIRYYDMLTNPKDAYKLVGNNEFRFYFTVFNRIDYKHPKPLFMRALDEFYNGKINKEVVTSVVSEVIKFMIKFLSISGRDSKDVIPTFRKIMEYIYQTGLISIEIVNNEIATKLSNITSESLKIDLQQMDAYGSKDITISLLALYESSYNDENNKLKISYDQAYNLLSSFSSSFSLDHLLVQTPDANSKEFKYYNNNGKLVLKDGHDFPTILAIDDMEYALFEKNVLNRIGNLRIYYKDKNSSRQNNVISLNEYQHFYNYKNVDDRGLDIANKLIDKILVSARVNLQDISTSMKDKSFPRMDSLINWGLVNIGDSLYIKTNPNDSIAKLIDSKHVEFNGKKMALNEWGCLVTGWSSINIYRYVARVGENETLQQIRFNYLNKNGQKNIIHTLGDGFNPENGADIVSISILDVKKDVSGWRDLLVNLWSILYEKYPKQVEEFARKNEKFGGGSSKISYDFEKISGSKGKCIPNTNIYIETNRGSANMLDLCENILKSFNIDFSEFRYKIKYKIK